MRELALGALQRQRRDNLRNGFVIMLSIPEINTFVRSRPVDIELRGSSQPHTLVLHGGYDGQGDFFSIELRDVEYIETAGGFSLGGVVDGDFSVLSKVCSRWGTLVGRYTGRAIALWTADSETLESAQLQDRFLVVANSILCKPEAQWSATPSMRSEAGR